MGLFFIITFDDMLSFNSLIAMKLYVVNNKI